MSTTFHQGQGSSAFATSYEEKLHKKSRRRCDELLWNEFFKDPSQWWDNRNTKLGPTHPDFRQKLTKQPLWIDSWYTPSWVVEELRNRGAPNAQPCSRTHKATHGVGVPNSEPCSWINKANPLWIDSWYTPSWVVEELRNRGAPDVERCSSTLKEIHGVGALDPDPCRRINKLTHDVGAAHFALPQTHHVELCVQHDDPIHDEITALVASLRACTKKKDLYNGSRLHEDILRRGLLTECSDALVTMYAKCGMLEIAKELLVVHNSRDVISWTSLITGYVRQGRSQDALDCFECMQLEGLFPNAVTFASILKACGDLKAAEKGKHIHDEIIRQGLLRDDVVLGNALIDMYAKCNCLNKAQGVLMELSCRNVVSWSSLIAGYAQQGQGEQALDCFERMQEKGCSPDAMTYACILKACGILGAIDKGEQIHDIVARQGLLQNNVVLGTALVDMYAKCGALKKAECALWELSFRNVFTWSALIAGYSQRGQGEQALTCFERMQSEGIPPNEVTYACILNACGTLGAADKGKQIHDEITRHGLLENSIILGNALVDMYAKCGALTKARRMLEELPSRDVISWNALITGYAQHGQDEQAMNCFKRMHHEGIHPNATTFSCVLSVCNHLGLVEDAYTYFVDMSTKYGIEPDLEICTCMIDLFGRAGHLQKAVEVIQGMPSTDNSAIWHALLGACQTWRDVKIGRWAFEQALQVDKGDGPAYVLMANIYAAAGMQEEANNIEAMCKGLACGTMRGTVRAFSVMDTSHD